MADPMKIKIKQELPDEVSEQIQLVLRNFGWKNEYYARRYTPTII